MTHTPTHCPKCGDALEREPIRNASHPDFGRDMLVCLSHGAAAVVDAELPSVVPGREHGMCGVIERNDVGGVTLSACRQPFGKCTLHDRGTVTCDECGGEHVAEYSHQSVHNDDVRVFVVYCTEDDDALADYYLEERVNFDSAAVAR